MCYENVWVWVLLTGRPQFVMLQLSNSSFLWFSFLGTTDFLHSSHFWLWAQQVQVHTASHYLFWFDRKCFARGFSASPPPKTFQGSLYIFSIYFSLCNWNWSKFGASFPIFYKFFFFLLTVLGYIITILPLNVFLKCFSVLYSQFKWTFKTQFFVFF